jgi:hypothetical protein
MDNDAHHKEKSRLDICLAAIEVARTGGNNFVLAEIIPEERRNYLYAAPDGEVADKKYGVSALVDALSKTDVPYSVNWNSESEAKGLRYLPDFVRVPESLRPFTGAEARKEWSAWRDREKTIDATVAGLAQLMLDNPEADLELAKVERVNDVAARMVQQRPTVAPTGRKQRSDERS